MADPISIVCWKWHKDGYRARFTPEHVHILRDMIRRNTRLPHRFICVTDDAAGLAPDIETVPLWPNPAPNYGRRNRPNCFYRLRAFAHDMADILGKRFLSLDLDCVITGNIDHILSDASDFKIWKVDGATMPCNGSMFLHKSGTRTDIWESFEAGKVHPIAALRLLHGFQGSDQAQIAACLKPDQDFFTQKDGIYSYRLHLKQARRLPDAARIVFFHGRHNPWDADMQRRHGWIRRHWRRDFDPVPPDAENDLNEIGLMPYPLDM